MKKWLKRLAKLVGAFVLVMFLLTEPWSWIFGQPRITVSKETTYFTEPLRPDGLVDYPAIINAKLSAGVTPETNAVTLLIRLVPKDKWQPGQLEATCKAIGIEVPKEEPIVYKTFGEFITEHKSELDEEDAGLLYVDPDQREWLFAEVTHRPWSRKEFPLLAAWLEDSATAISILSKAAIRQHYFEPIILQNDYEPAILADQPLCWPINDLRIALAARVMLDVTENDLNQAENDLITCERLSRLFANGTDLTHQLLAVSLANCASKTWGLLLFAGQRKPEDLKRISEKLNGLSKPPAYEQVVSFSERALALDLVSKIPYVSINANGNIVFSQDAQHASLQGILLRATTDLNEAMRVVNRRYDRVAAALATADVSDRIKAVRSIEADRSQLRHEYQDRRKFLDFFFTRSARGRIVGEDMTERCLVPSVELFAQQELTVATWRNVAKISLALESFRLAEGRFPEGLDELVPNYLAKVPQDELACKPFSYTKTEQGYRLKVESQSHYRDEELHTSEVPYESKKRPSHEISTTPQENNE